MRTAWAASPSWSGLSGSTSMAWPPATTSRGSWTNGTESDSSYLRQTLSGFRPGLVHQWIVLGAALADPGLDPGRPGTHPVAGNRLQCHLSQQLGGSRIGMAQFTTERLHRLPRPLETQLPG